MPKKSLKLKKKDNVLIICGEDKGKSGKIIGILPQKNRALVEGVNLNKKHMKPTQKAPQGGIVIQESSVHVSNIKLVCNKCNKPTDIKYVVTKEGNKVRTCKKCGEIIDKV